MVDLAQHGHHGPVSRQDIAERQELSADYVAQLFRHLQSAGLVEGGKGPGGGYCLLRDPSLIRAGQCGPGRGRAGCRGALHLALPGCRTNICIMFVIEQLDEI